MNQIAVWALSNLAACVCFGIAGFMAIRETEGWGWFLFVGLMALGSVPKITMN